jgi:hypothetical protein
MAVCMKEISFVLTLCTSIPISDIYLGNPKWDDSFGILNSIYRGLPFSGLVSRVLTPFLTYFPRFEKKELALWNHLSVPLYPSLSMFECLTQSLWNLVFIWGHLSWVLLKSQQFLCTVARQHSHGGECTQQQRNCWRPVCRGSRR